MKTARVRRHVTDPTVLMLSAKLPVLHPHPDNLMTKIEIEIEIKNNNTNKNEAKKML